MYVRKLKFNGIKGIKNQLEIDLSPTNLKMHKDNIEDFGLKRNKKDFSVLKQVIFTGLNASGKTSILHGLVTTFDIIANPSIGMQSFAKNKNSFLNNKPFSVLMEIVQKSESEKFLVEKYVIEYTLQNNKFIYEKLTKSRATKFKVQLNEEIYKFEKDVLYLHEKRTNLKHNPLFSIFSLIRMGSANEDVFGSITQENFFRKFNIFYSSLFEPHVQMLQDLGNLKIGVYQLKNEQDLLVKFLRVFDESILDYQVNINSYPSINVINKLDGSTTSIPFERFGDFLSSGTYSAYVNFKSIIFGLKNKSVVVFDEFAKDVHAGLTRIYFEIIRKLKSQVWITTHNPQIFKQKIRKDQFYNISIDKKNGNAILKRFSDENLELDARHISLKTVLSTLDETPDGSKVAELYNAIESENGK